MNDRVSAYTHFVLDLHKRNTNFSRNALRSIDKHLEEGKISISLCSFYDKSHSSKKVRWKTAERGVPGIKLAECLYAQPISHRLIREHLQHKNEKKAYEILSVTSEQCPEEYRNLLLQEGLRDHLLLPLYYEKQPLGFLNVFRGKEDPFFTQEDLHILQEASRCISSFYYFDNRNRKNVTYYFHRFLDGMDVGAALIDKQLHILESNDAFEEYFSYVWKEGILTGKIPDVNPEHSRGLSDPQKLINHFGSRIIVRPGKLRCDCMIYNYRLYTKPLAYANPFGEIENIYLVYVSQYKKISSEETMNLLRELTPRENELLLLLTEGNDNHQIAEKLHITTYTVKSHLQSIYRKLDVTNKTELITKLYGK